MIEQLTPDGGTIVTGESDIALVRLMTLRSALKLETKGLRRRGPSALSIVKRELGFKGNASTVLAMLTAKLDQMKADRNATPN